MPTFHPRPWRVGSVFGAGPRRPLDRNQRARFRYLTRAHARAGRLPAKAQWVAEALLKRLGEDGQCDPSHDTLAADAGCSARTVQRATNRLRELGLVRWTTRLVRSEWRAEQTSNAYELATPAGLVLPACDRQSGGQTGKDCSKGSGASQEALREMLRQARGLPDLLAARRTAIEGRWGAAA